MGTSKEEHGRHLGNLNSRRYHKKAHAVTVHFRDLPDTMIVDWTPRFDFIPLILEIDMSVTNQEISPRDFKEILSRDCLSSSAPSERILATSANSGIGCEFHMTESSTYSWKCPGYWVMSSF